MSSLKLKTIFKHRNRSLPIVDIANRSLFPLTKFGVGREMPLEYKTKM